MNSARDVPRRELARRLEQLYPGATIEAIEPLTEPSSEDIEKGHGYGSVVRVSLRAPGGEAHDLVLHTARSDQFGHDRRADRAATMLLDYDRFGAIPRHARALDVGAIAESGQLCPVSDCGEFYLITEYVKGSPYAEDLSRVAASGEVTDQDLDRCVALADYLAQLHQLDAGGPVQYVRAVRDLVGHGEGIFGVVDGYPRTRSPSELNRLQIIESRCVAWRRRLRPRTHRLARIHGDFHPFNVLFDGDELAVLDTSRGSAGDPADDVTCMAINYVFFGVERDRQLWRSGLGRLWRRFWSRYLSTTADSEMLDVAPPYLAWRLLVLASPVWYPSLSDESRQMLLEYAEQVLGEPRFDPESAEALL